MKNFDIETIEKSLKEIEEISEVVKVELAKRPAFYSKLCGIERQASNGFIKGRARFKTVTLLKMYKVIREELNKN